MEFDQVLSLRQSNRAFTDRQVSREQLSALLNAAMAAPTAMARFERLHLTVVQDPAVLEELNQLFQRAVGDESAYPTYHAPAIICVSDSVEDEELLMGANVGCVMENMLLKATELGRGSVYLFGLFAATRALSDQTRIPKLLKLPEGFRPVSAIAVGYPAQPLSAREVPEGKVAVTWL